MSSKHYSIVRDADGVIVNRIVLADGSDFAPEPGHTLVLDEGFDIGGNYVDGKYTPPVTPEPTLKTPSDYALSDRQLRIGLLMAGFDLANIQAAIDAIPDAMQRAIAQVWWDRSIVIHWDHPMTQTLIGLVGLTTDQAGAMWMMAKDLEA